MEQLQVFEAFREQRTSHWYDGGFNADGSYAQVNRPCQRKLD